MKKILTFFFMLFSATSMAAQAPSEAQPAPSTKIEAFSARTGVVMIRGFSGVGTLFGNMGTEVSIDAREFRDASNPKSQELGISIEVKETGRFEKKSTSYIDYDEIDSLIKGIDYISKIEKSVTSLNDFEAGYKTKGDFSITTFSNSSGGISVAVSSGRIGKATAFISLSDLSKLSSIINKAKQDLDSIKRVHKK